MPRQIKKRLQRLRLSDIRDKLDKIDAKLDKVLRLLAPNETKTLPSQIVGSGSSAFGRRTLADTPIRQSGAATSLVDKNLGTLA